MPGRERASPVVVRGRSVGEKIGQGPVRLIKEAHHLHTLVMMNVGNPEKPLGARRLNRRDVHQSLKAGLPGRKPVDVHRRIRQDGLA
jgi:hypothetical protein